jgi:ATP-dependent HslUV protease subunit HslV
MTVVAALWPCLACDSRVTRGTTVIGQVRKFLPAPVGMGGGIIAGAGSVGTVTAALDAVNAGDRMPKGDYRLLHLRADRQIRVCDDGEWYDLHAPCAAIGSGGDLAIGAMAAGADAETAVRIAIAHDAECGGDVHVFDARTGMPL